MDCKQKRQKSPPALLEWISQSAPTIHGQPLSFFFLRQRPTLILMRSAQLIFLAAALTAATSLAQGQPVTTLTQAGYTGLGLTPNALLLGWGRAEFTYDNQLPGVVKNPTGHNFVVGFGLLPYLEVAGRLATNTINSNCFTQGCGTRDLSASTKIGFGLDPAYHWRIAAGATDIGG